MLWPALASGAGVLPAARAAATESVYGRWLSEHFSVRTATPELSAAPSAWASLAFSNLEVSSDTAAGRFVQSGPAVARTSASRLLAFWLDDKKGVPRIRAARFQGDLSPTGSEFELFTDQGERFPDQLACTQSGGQAALTWRNGRPYAIRFALVDSLGIVTLENTAGNVAGPPWLGSPDVATYAGRILVVWEEFRLGWRLVGQRFDLSGAPVGSNLLLDGGADTLLKVSPEVAGDTSGGFCLVWSQGDLSRADIYVRTFDSLGTPRGAAVKVSTEVSGESYLLPQVTFLPAANRFFLVYVQADLPSDSTALWRCSVRPDGTLDGSPLALPAGPYPWTPAAAVSAGRVTTYTARYDNLSEIRSLAFDAAGVVESTTVIATDVLERSAVTSTSGSDTLLAVWQDRRSGDFDVYGLTRAAGTTVAGARALQTEGPGGQQTDADLSQRLGNGALVVYADFQREGDIALVEVSEAGGLVARRRASDDTILAPQYDPHIATSPSGFSLITWTDERTDWPGPAVHAAGRFAQAGLFTTSSFPLYSTGTALLCGQTDVAMGTDRTSAVVWVDDRTGSARAYLRRFTSAGVPEGAEVALEDGSQSGLLISFEQDPVVTKDSNGQIWTVWTAYDLISESHQLLVQSWTATGVRRGTNQLLAALSNTVEPPDVDAAALPGALLRLVWFDAEAASPAVLTAVFDTLGAMVSGPDTVSGAPVAAASPRVALDVSGRWAVAWSQSASPDEILWQRYDADGTPTAPVERISGTSPAVRLAPAVIFSGNYVYGAWHDNADTDEGFDVRLSSLLKAQANVRHDALLPSGFDLYPSYPNPFNGQARIAYSLETPAAITLTVFDALGRRVRILAHGPTLPGRHELLWDGTDQRGREVASGVYFYRLEAGPHSYTRKLVYLK